MRGTSNAVFADAEERLPAMLATDPSGGYESGEAIFGIADALSASTTLLHSISDPAATGAARATVLESMLDDRFRGEFVNFLRWLVMQRWASDNDLIEALEELGRDCVIASLAKSGRLDEVEDQLVAFQDSLNHSDAKVRDFFTDPDIDPQERAKLVDNILAHRVDPAVLLLARRAALNPPHERYVISLEKIENEIAAHKRRAIAHVISAVELTDLQKIRLEKILERKYGYRIQVYTSIDPSIIGGLRIEVGPDVIDDTVVTRLAAARAALVG